jgi:molybdopterin biosynthesis enzyme
MIEMIAFAQARSLVLGAVSPLPPERIEVTAADGRVLAEATAALVDLPSARIVTRLGTPAGCMGISCKLISDRR